MCFDAPYIYIHMDRCTDANKTIYAFFTWSYHHPYPEGCADMTRLYAVFGVKYEYPHVLSFPPFPFLTFTHGFSISPFVEGPFYIKPCFRPHYRANS